MISRRRGFGLGISMNKLAKMMAANEYPERFILQRNPDKREYPHVLTRDILRGVLQLCPR
jgi:hypothetical protein